MELREGYNQEPVQLCNKITRQAQERRPGNGINLLKWPEKFQSEHPDFKVLKYAPEIKDVQIADGWAIEVGDFGGTYRMSAKDNVVSVQGEGMRVLKRQRYGSWKFALLGLK